MTNKNFNAKNVIITAVAAIALSFVFTTTASAEDIRVKSSENIRVKSDKDSTNGDGNVFTDFLNRVFGVRV